VTDLELYFRFRCEKGLKERGLSDKPEYKERLKHEIDVISKMGFAGYFLIVSDIVRWAISNGIPVGPGRGSAAGSLVSYVLEITHLDPIRYGLIFERFLNPERVSMPDIDLDFCEERRGEVFNYVIDKYGHDSVAHIGTYGTMKARASIRDVARTLGFPYDLGDKLANLVLPPIEGKAQPLATCYDKVAALKNIRNGENTDEKLVLKWAEKLEDRIRSFGTHASGVVISEGPITQSIPLYNSTDNVPATQFEMYTVEDVGLIKFDFLGLSALTTVRRCVHYIERYHGIKVNILNIPVDDEETYKNLRAGNVEGVFQLEGSSGIRDLLVQIRPTKLDDLAVLVAIYRPGPLGSDMLQHYLRVRAGETTPTFAHQDLEPILGPTDGMLIFQEQVLEICKQLAGYTMGEADLMRRAVGKKKEKEMAAQEGKFKKGMTNNGYDIATAETLWNDIKAFASYGFNRAHAACYAYIGYQMAWLKTHYPREFMCACLMTDAGNEDKIIRYIAHCKTMGIDVLPPCINRSHENFVLAEDTKDILFGLGSIKNLGKPVFDIVDERKKNGPYKDILDLINRSGDYKINSRQLESLVLAGAFDNTPYNRHQCMRAIEDYYLYKKQLDSYNNKMETYRKYIQRYEERQKEWDYWDGLTKEEAKELRKQGRKRPGNLKIPKPPEKPLQPKFSALSDFTTLEKLDKEKELLGFYISGHPLDFVQSAKCISIDHLKEHGISDRTYTILAVPAIMKEITTKHTKKRMSYVVLEDKTGTIQVVVLPKPFAEYGRHIAVGQPALYTGKLEVTEGDEKRIFKVLINAIEPVTMSEPEVKEINVVVPLEIAQDTAKYLADNNGSQTTANFRICHGGNTWDFGPIGSRIPVQAIRNRLGEKYVRDI